MKFIRSNFLFLLLPVSFILVSWGYQAHYHINARISYSFTYEMQQFLPWSSFLEQHAADADKRKPYTPGESIKHYIDIDNFPCFIANGCIPHNIDSAITIYGSSFVYSQGILPWATKTTFDTLVNCFMRRDWNKAMLTAADLGHYVADGHMPLHLTANYNGSVTGNYGIHSRYETTMINTYLAQINYQGDSVYYINNVQDYIFNYIYQNCVFVDSIINADNYAQSVAGNSSSSTYTSVLWQQTSYFTNNLFKNASYSTACLIYTAWTLAGKPLINQTSEIQNIDKTDISLIVFPNPCEEMISFRINQPVNNNSTILIVNSAGRTVYKASSIQLYNEPYQVNTAIFPPGSYQVIINNDKERIASGKMIKK